LSRVIVVLGAGADVVGVVYGGWDGDGARAARVDMAKGI